jgi:tetratricopeptide (TPR) repeat protein
MLRPRKKISRREIKEDKLVTIYIKVQKFIKRYNRQINFTTMGLLVIIVIVFFVARSKKGAESTAEGKLALVEQFYYAKNYDQCMGEFENIIATYPGTRAAGITVFFMANIHYKQGNYNEAQRYYELYITDYSDIDIFTASSLVGIAACLENRNDFESAGEYYERAAKKYKDAFTTPFYLKNAARCYIMAAKPEKGKTIYQTILDQYPDFGLAREVEFLLKSMS